MTFDINNLPEQFTVVDDNGIPDHILKPQEVLDDGFTLALAIGGSEGDEATIGQAISRVQNRWGGRAGYVFTSAIMQLGRDLLPEYLNLAKTTSGVDFPAHCRQMNNSDYNPQEVDQ